MADPTRRGVLGRMLAGAAAASAPKITVLDDSVKAIPKVTVKKVDPDAIPADIKALISGRDNEAKTYLRSLYDTESHESLADIQRHIQDAILRRGHMRGADAEDAAYEAVQNIEEMLIGRVADAKRAYLDLKTSGVGDDAIRDAVLRAHLGVVNHGRGVSDRINALIPDDVSDAHAQLHGKARGVGELGVSPGFVRQPTGVYANVEESIARAKEQADRMAMMNEIYGMGLSPRDRVRHAMELAGTTPDAYRPRLEALRSRLEMEKPARNLLDGGVHPYSPEPLDLGSSDRGYLRTMVE